MRFDESFRFASRIPYWECSRILCAAQVFDRAHIAFRLPGYANKRAKIQQSGVESRGIGFREKTPCMLPERLPARVGIDRSAKIEKPREHTSCVRFDDWDRLIESKAGHCMGSVFPDSGELS